MNTEQATHDEIKAVKHGRIDQALLAAQLEFLPIDKDKTNSHFNSKYASLDSLIKATRPALAKHGLVCYGKLGRDEKGDPICTTFLKHVDSDDPPWEEVVPAYFANNMQSVGSAITYARRQGRSLILDICGDEDDDGNAAGQGQQPKQNQNSGGQRQQSQRSGGKQQGPDSQQKQPAKTQQAAAQSGEKKSLLEQIKERIATAADPAELVSILANSNKNWPDKKEFLESIFDACGEENIARVARGFTYDNVGKQQVWDEEDRKWVFSELTKIMDGKSEPAGQANEPGPEPEAADWPARIAAVAKSEDLFTLISEMADDADLTADLNSFNAVCGLITAKLDASTKEWGEGAVKISRQFLSQRITAVEMQHDTNEAMNNATAQ